MSTSVFLDSGAFIAFLNRRDRWHAQTVALFNGPKPRWATSILVISETYSWFLHRMGEEQARTFRTFVRNLSGVRVYAAPSELDDDVAGMLDRFRGAKLTYVDASSLHFLERHKIRTVWATDHHLGMTGATVLPRN